MEIEVNNQLLSTNLIIVATWDMYNSQNFKDVSPSSKSNFIDGKDKINF